MAKNKVLSASRQLDIEDLTMGDVFIRHPFSRYRFVSECVGESMTHQSHADACDINNILKRYESSGVMPTGRSDGQFADVTGLQGDLTEQINKSREVQAAVAKAESDAIAKQQKEAADKAAADAADLARFREAEAKAKARADLQGG